MAKKPAEKKRTPLRSFSKAGYNQAGKNTILDKGGRLWKHVLTAQEEDAKRLELFYKRAGKDFKLVRNGKVYEVFVRRD